MSSGYGLRIQFGEASNPGPLQSSQAEFWADADFSRDHERDSPTERDVMWEDVNSSSNVHVAQFDLARFDSSCDEDTRGRVETSDVPRRVSHQRYGMCAIRRQNQLFRAPIWTTVMTSDCGV